jgi:hypothetical protein
VQLAASHVFPSAFVSIELRRSEVTEEEEQVVGFVLRFLLDAVVL